MITTLFTDLGGVLFIYDETIFDEEVSKRTIKPQDEPSVPWHESKFVLPSHEGTISGEEYLQGRAEELGITSEELVEIWDLLSSANKPYLDFVAQWKKSGKGLYLLSNINISTWEYYRGYPIFSEFDGLFLSYELGLIKPHPEIYLECLKRSGKTAQEVLFVDDLAENIEAARKLGFNVWQYDPSNQEEMEEFIRQLIEEAANDG